MRLHCMRRHRGSRLFGGLSDLVAFSLNTAAFDNASGSRDASERGARLRSRQ